MRYCFVLLLLCAAASVHAQAPVNYNDVLLIINSNDTNSVAIGDYFAAKRDIPQRNILRVDAPAKETINFEEFQAIRAQIEAYLNQTGLRDSINFFVTTKGVPLRVQHAAGDDPSNASFDAEIMLILGSYESHIGQNTLFPTPTSFRIHSYFRKDAPYRRKDVVPFSTPPSTYDMYLTTRLIGLTKEDVFALIDRSGPYTLVNKDSALFVFDRDPRPIQLDPYDNNLGKAGTLLAGRGWKVLVNTDSTYVTNQRNVMGYGSWGSNDHYDHHYTQFARPLSHWLPGSLAETYVSTSARNFIPGQTAGQSRIADLIAEGCVGASGYVFEPYTVALTWVDYLFDRYTRGYNLAESFYMSNPTFSWMAVVVGDPKTSIITAMPPRPTPAIAPLPNSCAGTPLTLQSTATSAGLLHWFRGDTTAVLSQGPPYDATHPLWFASGAQTVFTPSAPGQVTISLLNENFVGKGWAQGTATILPELLLQVQIPTDTLYLDEQPTLLVSAVSPDADSVRWSFGDGGTSTLAQTSHTYSTTGSFRVRCTASRGICTTSEERTVIVRATRPAVKVQEDQLAYGLVQITKQKTLSVVVENRFPSAVQLLSAVLEGSHSTEFGIEPLSFPLSIPSMGQRSIAVSFSPAEVGLRTARLVLTFSGMAGILTVDLQGEGTLDPTDVKVTAGAVLEFDLLQSYPNPSTDFAIVPFALNAPSHVRISVVDAAGRAVSVVTDGVFAPGLHKETLDTRSLRAGTYFLILEAEGKRISRAFNIVR